MKTKFIAQANKTFLPKILVCVLLSMAAAMPWQPIQPSLHLDLTDIVRENVHILGVKVSKVIRPPRGPGAGTPGGFLILP